MDVNNILNNFLSNTNISTNLQRHVEQSVNQRNHVLIQLFKQTQIPIDGVDELTIEYILITLSSFDSNNHIKNASVGEREARLFSNLVSRRHFHLAHGIGRSGDLNETQPKAIGSSIIYHLTNKLAFDALKISNIHRLSECLVVPLATGMTLALCMRALSKNRQESKYIIWPRIDQKSCFKSILSAGFIPIIIQNYIENQQLRTDIPTIERTILELQPQSILCIMTTTSCFAPRAPDDILSVGNLCKSYDIPHLINNAYGIQVETYCNLITQAIKNSRVDLIVQSTDKNFMVPVGGCLVASPDPKLIKIVANSYAGRASISPVIDLFITLLEMGKTGYKTLLKTRQTHFKKLKIELSEIATEYGLELLSTPNNFISLSLNVSNLDLCDKTKIGRRLFFKSVSGCRVVEPDNTKIIDGYTFINWGSHHNHYPHPYISCSASIGMKDQDLSKFIKRLREVLKDLIKK